MNILLAGIIFGIALKMATTWFNTMRDPWTADDVLSLIAIIFLATCGIVILAAPLIMGDAR